MCYVHLTGDNVCDITVRAAVQVVLCADSVIVCMFSALLKCVPVSTGNEAVLSDHQKIPLTLGYIQKLPV